MLKQLITLGCLLVSGISIAQNDVSPVNSDFQRELEYWDYGVWVADGARPVVKFKTSTDGHGDNRSANIRLISANYYGDSFDAHMTTRLQPLKKGKDYELEFWVKSNSEKNHSIAFKIYSGRDYKTELFIQTVYFSGDSEWHRITKTFEAFDATKLFDYKNAMLQFGVAGEHGSFLIDDVTVKRI